MHAQSWMNLWDVSPCCLCGQWWKIIALKNSPITIIEGLFTRKTLHRIVLGQLKRRINVAACFKTWNRRRNNDCQMQAKKFDDFDHAMDSPPFLAIAVAISTALRLLFTTVASEDTKRLPLQIVAEMRPCSSAAITTSWFVVVEFCPDFRARRPENNTLSPFLTSAPP